MDSRIEILIDELRLGAHPEGGHYRRVYRSARAVQPLDGRPPRPALTTIYYLLAAGEHSRWHRVKSDEAWHFYEGDPLELFWIDETDESLHREILSASLVAERVAVVPAGCWQAARSTGAYSLVGCTVAPGFDFDDFEILIESSADRDRVMRITGELPPFD